MSKDVQGMFVWKALFAAFLLKMEELGFWILHIVSHCVNR